MFKKHTAIVCAAYFMTAFHVSADDSSLDGERYRLETTPDSAIQSDDFEGVSRRVDFVESLNKEPILDNLNEVERVIFQIGTAYRPGVDLKKNDSKSLIIKARCSLISGTSQASLTQGTTILKTRLVGVIRLDF